MLYRLAYGEGEVRVSMSDEDGKVDLNGAPPELLAGLLGQLGLDAEDAETMAEGSSISRSGPDRPHGAEDPQYATAGRPAGAQDRPFAAASELLGVLGITPELYRRMRPYVTIFSGAEAVDPLRASRVVLAAIPGMTQQLIEAYAEAGPDEDPLASIDEDSAFDIEPYLIPSREVMYTVRAEAGTAGGGVFVREAVIELTGEPGQPFRVHAWRRGYLDDLGPEAASARG